MINTVKRMLATTLFGLLMASSAQATGDSVTKLVFHNCIHSPLSVNWDAHHYNINAPWKPELERPKGTFSVADGTSVDLHASDETIGLSNNSYINMHIETPRGPIWLIVYTGYYGYDKPTPWVIRGAAEVTPLASSAAGFQIDIDCPWNNR